MLRSASCSTRDPSQVHMDKGLMPRGEAAEHKLHNTFLAVRGLDNELLMIEATGDHTRAKKLIADLVVVRPAVQKALDRLAASVPNDIRPIFTTAAEITEASNAGAPRAVESRSNLGQFAHCRRRRVRAALSA